MKRHQNLAHNFDYDIRTMMNIFGQSHSIGKNLHIWRRRRLPNIETVHNFSCKSWNTFRSYVELNFEIDESASCRWILDEKEIDDRLRECIHLKNGYTIYFTGYDTKVELIFDSESSSEYKKELLDKLNEFKEPRGNDEIGLLVRMHGGLDVKFFKFRQYEHNIIPYLGNDIQVFYKNIIRQIKSEHKSGLYLLHGEPGTGKTSFIKTILSEV